MVAKVSAASASPIASRAVVAASPASFQPSKAARSTGPRSRGRRISVVWSMTSRCHGRQGGRRPSLRSTATSAGCSRVRRSGDLARNRVVVPLWHNTGRETGVLCPLRPLALSWPPRMARGPFYTLDPGTGRAGVERRPIGLQLTKVNALVGQPAGVDGPGAADDLAHRVLGAPGATDQAPPGGPRGPRRRRSGPPAACPGAGTRR